VQKIIIDCEKRFLGTQVPGQMPDISQLLTAGQRGDALAADQLLPLVYEELRTLAASKMTQENPGQTLQATALVHEAFVRLVDVQNAGTV
jgi:hypothetical protein